MAFLLFVLLAAQSSAIGTPIPPPSSPSWSIDPARAVRNYQAVAAGTIRFHDLTPQEQAEVAEVERLLRAQQAQDPKLSDGKRCRRAAESPAPTPLERAITNLICSGR
jgi:hypothetical protein